MILVDGYIFAEYSLIFEDFGSFGLFLVSLTRFELVRHQINKDIHRTLSQKPEMKMMIGVFCITKCEVLGH